LLDLARACAADLQFGRDQTPDLMLISISATDYAGHVFGPDSWEYVDVLRRSDRALARLVDALDAHARLSVLVSSDHGVTPLPEQAPVGGRVFEDELARELDARVDAALGQGEWVAAFVSPFVTLGADSRARRDEVVQLVITGLARHPGVHSAHDVNGAEQLRASGDPLLVSVGVSIGPAPPGDVFVVTRPGFIVDPDLARGQGTSHGSPWQPDREVFVAAWGEGVPRLVEPSPVDARRIAPTIAGLLRIAPPAGAAHPELFSVERH
jgi:hypothetical protein